MAVRDRSIRTPLANGFSASGVLLVDSRERIEQARALRDRGCHDAAVELLASVLRANPRDIEAHRELALVRFAQGRRAWAESLLRRAAMLEEVIAVELAAGAEADDRQSLASDVAYAIRGLEDSCVQQPSTTLGSYLGIRI